MTAKVRGREYEHNEFAWVAWHVAALQRVKKLPKLEKFLSKRKKRERQTSKQMRKIIEMHHALHGGVDKRKKK